MLRKDALIVLANKENNGQVFMTRAHLFFNHGKVALAVAIYQKKIAAKENQHEKADVRRAKQLFNKLAAIEFNSPDWRDAAIKIRTQIEGKEIALLEVIRKYGQDLTNKLMGKIAMGDPQGAHFLMKESMIRKLCGVFHPDKWHSPHSDEVFSALLAWAIHAKDLLEQVRQIADVRAENKAVHDKLLDELKGYIRRTHEHLRESGEFFVDVPNVTTHKI